MPKDEDYSCADVNRALTSAQKLHLYREMVRVRIFEQAALRCYTWGKMAGFLMLHIGQEAISVGVRSLMGPNDHSISGSRGIGHAVAAGMTMNECMAELYGKATGSSKGKGGMFSFFAPERHHWGCFASAGSQTPLACGLAFALKQQGTTGAAFCFLGDGAVNQGSFHESLNLAALFDLPMIFVIENNGYAGGTSVARGTAFKNSLAQRADGYGIEWDVINGDHLYEVRARMQPAIDRAYRDQRPSVLEITTYRFTGFSVADAMATIYRTKQEIELHHKYHDPVKLWKEQLLREAITDEAALDRIRLEAWAEAGEAADFADQSPFPEPSAVCEDVFWEVDHGTSAGKTGRHFFNDR